MRYRRPMLFQTPHAAQAALRHHHTSPNPNCHQSARTYTPNDLQALFSRPKKCLTNPSSLCYSVLASQYYEGGGAITEHIAIERNPDAKKLRIMEAATELFVDQGYFPTTFDHIAAEAGVARGSITRHFGTKSNLALEILLSLRIELAEHLKQVQEGLSSSEEIVLVRTREFIRWCVANKHKATYVFALRHSEFLDDRAHGRPDDAMIGTGKRWIALGKSWVGEGQERGEVRSGRPYLLGLAAASPAVYLAQLVLEGEVDFNLLDIADELARLTWDMLRARDGSSPSLAEPGAKERHTQPKRSRRRSAANSKDRIAETAMSLFVEQGYFPTTLDQIASIARVSKQAIAEHFNRKADLARDVLFMLRTEMGAALRPVYGQVESGERTMRDAVAAFLDWCSRHPTKARYLFALRHKEFLDDAPGTRSDELVQIERQGLVAAQRRGEVRAGGPDLLMYAQFGVAVVICRLILEGWLDYELEDVKDDLAQLSWDMVRCR